MVDYTEIEDIFCSVSIIPDMAAIADGMHIPEREKIKKNDINLEFKQEEIREVEEFNSIKIENFFGDIQINSNKEKHAIEILAGNRTIQSITTVVSGGQLLIIFNKKINTAMPVNISINTRNIFYLDIQNSSVTVNINHVNSKEFTFLVKGASSVSADGHVENLYISAFGSVDLYLKELKSNKCRIVLNGTSDAIVNVSGLLTAEINGASDIVYFGKPASVSKKINGTGDISPISIEM